MAAESIIHVDGLVEISMLALAVASISTTISVAKVFASLRAWISSRNGWLGDLVSCPYCMSHWVSFLMIAAYRPVLIDGWLPMDLVVSAFATVTISVILIGTMMKLLSLQVISGERTRRSPNDPNEL